MQAPLFCQNTKLIQNYSQLYIFSRLILSLTAQLTLFPNAATVAESDLSGWDAYTTSNGIPAEFNDIDPAATFLSFASDVDGNIPEELLFNDIDPSSVNFAEDEFALTVEFFGSPRDEILEAERRASTTGSLHLQAAQRDVGGGRHPEEGTIAEHDF